ncbi:MAG: tetratricopeptide repeat protein [Smithella sp.]|nr:tetratricopeptide repeat protein [Smithella sp.]
MKKDTPSARFNRAIQLEKSGDHVHALSEYRALISEYPSFRNAYVNLGSLYSRMEHLPEAIKCYEAALSLGHDFITFFNMGCILYKMENYQGALKNLEQSVALNNNFALSKLIIGLCNSRLNKLQKAEKNFIDVLRIWPANRVALTALAIIYYNTGRYDRSLRLLDKLIQIDADDIKIRELKSDILLKTGRINESAAEIKVIKRKSEGYRFYDEFIKSIPVETLTDRLGTIDDKIKSLNDKVFADSSSLISLSLCHLFKGETDEAIDYLYKFKKKLLK